MDVDELELDGLDADERDICLFLTTGGGQLASVMEIARRAGGKKRFQEDPKWAGQVLLRLTEKGKIASDANGHYHLQSLRGKGAHLERTTPGRNGNGREGSPVPAARPQADDGAHSLSRRGSADADVTRPAAKGSLLAARQRSARDEETPREQQEPETWSCKGKKILLVEEDAELREAVAQALQDAGGEVSTAMDASDALVQMYDAKLDLIILTLDLSGEGGQKLLKSLKRNQPDVPVILHPGLKRENDAILALLAGKRPERSR